MKVICQNSKLLLRNKHSTSSSQQGGVKFFCDEKVGPIQALVNDPLPDVLLKSDILRSELAEKSISHEPPLENLKRNVDVPEPNNNTAHTYEQGDSKINSLDGTLKKRRKGKRWSSLEEQKLHDGVNKFGKGNWKEILNFNDEIFKEAGRTEVDLKEMWRNKNR
ncbi:Telomeric repeat-binding factor 2 [Senna tora]|uniref:Telomeric repeat-binding factor 2 n=1 Tax=Senna tora TaxID=362788 RepID=A0A834T6K7_9FABA|nr:Telomeric repeat-binding factor 2 [Senna tora]